MKHSITIFLVILFSTPNLFGQPTQAEIDKMMKQAQDAMNKYGKDSTVKNAMKDAQGKHDQVSEAMKNPQVINKSNSVAISDPGSYANVDNWKFPARKIALLNALPKKTLTRIELSALLNNVYSQLSKKMGSDINSSVQSLAAQYKNDITKMGNAAVMGWYTGHKEEALLLILKASSLSTGDLLLLNNCAALLNMSGIEQSAVPILKYVLHYQPNNSQALNNIGQAYAGLGETDTAMVYFGRCIQIVPDHPEACNTVAQIEASKGNKEKAIEYFEKSIKSAYSKPAALKLRKIKKGSKIAGLIRPRIKLPDYFNMFKYQLPAQCTNTSNAVVAEAEHNAFREMIMKQAQGFGQIYKELALKKAQEAMKMQASGRKLIKGEFLAQPFAELCSIMAGEVLDEYKDALSDLSKKINKVYAAEMSILETAYEKQRKAIADRTTVSDEEKCSALNELANQYLPKFAYLTEELQEKALHIFKQYFDELVYWHYLALKPTGIDNFRMRHIEFIEQYLVIIGGVAKTRIIKPCEFDELKLTKEKNEIKDFDCPLDIDIAFVVGAVEFNCDKFSIEGGEGLIFKYEREFKTRQSTLSIGIGVKLELGKEVFSTAVEQYAFVKFDGNGGCSDAGIKLDASVQAGSTVGVKSEVGYTLGVESGWDFNEGPFKNYLAPAPETQINKNVPIYKPGK